MKLPHLFSAVAALVAALLLSPVAWADIEVLGLFKGAALLKVDGEQKLLKVGQQWKGVALLEASSKQAIADIKGSRQTLTVSQRIGTNYTQPIGQTVRIPRNEHRQYITTAHINGRATRVLVDTGANILALNAQTARQLGVDYSKGVPSRVRTASGIVTGYQVMLDSVDVGGLKVGQVQASILEGPHPEMVLLGTSYLQHVHMQERDGILMLMSKF